MTIRKLLVANRGEIACRVIATARRLGIGTVAVYSEADRTAKHVQMADESLFIGPPAATESYLDGARMIRAAQDTGADAIHPGYGFLSENADFVEAVTAAGLTFVGAPAAAVRAMGLKDAAKALMMEAGVPVVPGYHGDAQDLETLAAHAAEIGFPVMIKARAGGGGKGMRRVDRAEDFAEALAGAQREGAASFGDPAVLIEKFIARPRHIEVQVFCDGQGGAVHLFERDCSLQRRHQKVIEEAPAPGMTAELRAHLGEIALRAARAVSYVGAGTVEFIADGSGPLRADGCWFMEMNTRLQVEHPVTEAITGLDLVEWQLRVAAGEALPLRQEDISMTGHAMEARIYAEDVGRGFLPATGRLRHLRFTPDARAFSTGRVRIDSGVEAGDEISPWYDPMIAKVIVHGPTREAARARLTKALGETEIIGPETNIPFLQKLAGHSSFSSGSVHTDVIAENMEELTAEVAPRDDLALVASLALLGLRPNAPLASWRAWGQAGYACALREGDETREVTIRHHGGATFEMAGKVFHATWLDHETWSVATQEGAARRVRVIVSGAEATVFTGTGAHRFARIDPAEQAQGAEGSDSIIRAPMPGIVKAVTCAVDQEVTLGQPLLVMEAMKMEHTLKAPRDGKIAELTVSPGAQVSEGAVLVQFAADDD